MPAPSLTYTLSNGTTADASKVMQNLNDPSKLGPGIAAAFVATIYGIASANLLFLPMASKLKTLIQAQVRDRELMLEGFLGIAEGENPRYIEARLEAFIDG